MDIHERCVPIENSFKKCPAKIDTLLFLFKLDLSSRKLLDDCKDRYAFIIECWVKKMSKVYKKNYIPFLKDMIDAYEEEYFEEEEDCEIAVEAVEIDEIMYYIDTDGWLYDYEKAIENDSCERLNMKYIDGVIIYMN